MPPDPFIARAATQAGRLVITLDRGFGDVLRYPPGTHAGILVLRVDDQSVRAVCEALRDVVESHRLVDLNGCVAVYRNGELRVRRPPAGGRSTAG